MNETVDQNSSKNKFGDRKSYFLVSLPGLNTWAVDLEKKLPTKYDEPFKLECSLATKRPYDNLDDSMQVDEEEGNKKLNNKSETFQNMVLSDDYVINSPLPTRPSRACIIKIYSEEDDYALGTLLDVVGFLSVDPSLDGSTREVDENQFETAEEIQSQNPPPSLVPRLHAICVKQRKHTNPSLELSIDNPLDIYQDLKKILTQCLFGDEIAAEYLMCHLICSIYARTEIVPLGQFALNITNIPCTTVPSYTEQFYKIIELLVPASYYLPATLDNLNTLPFFPKEDPNTNKLISGMLQLAPHTHFVFDETQMQPGKLNEAGINAVKNLSHVIDSQKIKCIFKYFQTEYDCDIPILILSEATSFLPKNFLIPLKYDADSVGLITEALTVAQHFLQTKLILARKFLTAMRMGEFEMDADVLKMIQDDFVRMRREKNAVMEDLHNLMVLSRLLGLVQGKKSLDEESWKRALFLEEERAARIRAAVKK